MNMMHNVDGEQTLHLHIDPRVMELIAEGKYVDFSKLLKDKSDEVENIELVTPEDYKFYIPASKPGKKIENFETWGKAFLVFQSAFQVYFPDVVGQLLEYQGFIERMSKMFDWHKVYAYDRHFRRVQAATPGHLWGLVNQNAKDQFLVGGQKDPERIKRESPQNGSAKASGGEKSNKRKKGLCRHFNAKNSCTFGERCYYDHRCAICGKPGHRAVVCFKRKEGQKDHKKELA